MPAAVDADTFTRDEIAVDQEEHSFSDFRSTAPSPERRGVDHFRILLAGQIRRLKDRPGCNRIDQDFWSQFQRETFSQRDNGGLGRIVRDKASVTWPAANGQPIREVN